MRKPALLFMSLIYAAAAHAAEQGTLSVSPAVVMLKGTFGQSATQKLILTNNTALDFSFEMAAQDVIVRDGKRTFVNAGEIAGSIAATAVFSRKTVKVHPGETAVVDVTVTLPEGAQHRGVVAVFKGTNRFMNGNVPMLASLGTLMTFATSDDVAADAGPLVVTPQSATKNLSIAQTCTNVGANPLVAKGVAAIVDQSGAMVGRFELEPRRMFPKESAAMHGEYSGELAPGQYRVLVTYDLGGKTLTSTANVEVR